MDRSKKESGIQNGRHPEKLVAEHFEFDILTSEFFSLADLFFLQRQHRICVPAKHLVDMLNDNGLFHRFVDSVRAPGMFRDADP